ncbi:hypothetical protein LZ198_41800 [Myxococcus sp. K15C18031901]|uniref:hypothetical protein n=1 Tax=Myxococcus dinghuensis TaxID=2906761 RepID=UPI0020A76B30|nr:hypothetical protein [Myxococcus dinghuensis]MCP3105417.1 hypothetical protein [Myxococcus dinghuensis]
MSRYVFTSTQHAVDVEVDRASQVIELEVPELLGLWGTGDSASSARLSPTLPGLSQRWGWAPLMAFSFKAKAFDDGLSAAIDLLAQAGAPGLPGKRGLLEALYGALRPRATASSDGALERTLALLHTALTLTGEFAESDRNLRLLGMKRLRDFEADPAVSRPLGFYAWSPRLRAVFKQDRLLQEVLEGGVAELLRQALQSDAGLSRAYQAHLSLMWGLSNRPSRRPVDGDGPERCFFPPSDSHEGRLVERLFQDVAPPEGFQLVDELVLRIRDGRLETTPAPEAGWYDHQFHALTPLLVPERMPESSRLVCGPHYRGELEQQFRALFGLTRETHVKQLAVAAGGPPPILLSPRLTVEPLAEAYLRRAESYRFVRSLLTRTVGAQALSSVGRETPEGPSLEDSLFGELVWMEQLFRGAHAIAREELGFEAVPEALLPAATLTRRWLRSWTQDPDLQRDSRMVVPLFFDPVRRKTKALAVLGFQATAVHASFLAEPEVRLHPHPGPRRESEVLFTPSSHVTVRPVCVEVYVSQVPDRESFRALCEQHGGPEAIARALESAPPATGVG